MELGKELQKKAKNITVLYAEDEENLQKEVHAFLSHFFDRIELASNGEEGLEKFRSHPFDLVMTDIKMPKLNGLQLAREVKKLDKNVKVIVTSAYDDKKLLLNAIEQNVDHYVVKPLDYSSLMAVLYKTVTLINLEKRVERLNRRKQAILDFQDNIIFTFKGDKITSANRKFLNFFRIDSIAEINEGKVDMVEYLVKEDGFFYPKDRNSWATEFQKNRECDLLVKLVNKKNHEPRTFAMKVGVLDEFDEIIITLSDISGYVENAHADTNDEHHCFYFDQNNIAQFFSYFQNEINRTKRYSLPLSVIQFSIDGVLTDKELEDIDGSVMRELTVMDFLAKPTKRKFIIVKIDTEIVEAEMLANRFYGDLAKRYAKRDEFTCSFGVAGMDAHDSIQSLLSRAEGLQKKARESGDAHIKTDYFKIKTPHELHSEKKAIYTKLADRKRKKQEIECIIFYNGMKVVDKASVYHVDPDLEEASFLLSPKQYAIVQSDDRIFIEMDTYSADVEGELVVESMHDRIVTLKNLRFADKSPLKREYVRIHIDKALPAKLDAEGQEYNGQMLDISIKSLALKLPMVKKLLPGKIININFVLEIDGKKEEVVVRGEIYKIEALKSGGYKIVVLLFTDRKVTHLITSYISHREKGIAREMKKQDTKA